MLLASRLVGEDCHEADSWPNKAVLGHAREPETVPTARLALTELSADGEFVVLAGIEEENITHKG